jgi:hypothetical protein
MPIRIRILPPNFTYAGKSEFYFLLLFTALLVYIVLSFSSAHRDNNFHYFEQHIEFFCKKNSFVLHLVEIDPYPTGSRTTTMGKMMPIWILPTVSDT